MTIEVGSLVFWLKTSYTGDYKVRGVVTKINTKTAQIRVRHPSGKHSLHNVRFENLEPRTEDQSPHARVHNWVHQHEG